MRDDSDMDIETKSLYITLSANVMNSYSLGELKTGGEALKVLQHS